MVIHRLGMTVMIRNETVSSTTPSTATAAATAATLLRPLSAEQIDTFLRDGILVVEDVLTPSELDSARRGLASTLQHYSAVNVNDLVTTGYGLKELSSTNGSGGVLDLYYCGNWKFNIALHPQLWSWTQQLWSAAFIHNGEARNTLPLQEDYRWHPFGPFNPSEGYAYIDRIGYRLPTTLAEQLGSDGGGGVSTTKNRAKRNAIQRCLTPHLDCCPETFFDVERASKWRPIQCLVSLSDTLEPNRGGLEVCHGFHREFAAWKRLPTARKPQMIIPIQEAAGERGEEVEQVKPREDGTDENERLPPCIGQYTHIRPREDAEIMKRIRHVPVPAGAVVFWDTRLPHSNAYRHDGDEPRAVVYCSFLPNIPLNQRYAQYQLDQWRKGYPPDDQWTGNANTSSDNHTKTRIVHEGPLTFQQEQAFTTLERKLLGIQSW